MDSLGTYRQFLQEAYLFLNFDVVMFTGHQQREKHSNWLCVDFFIWAVRESIKASAIERIIEMFCVQILNLAEA